MVDDAKLWIWQRVVVVALFALQVLLVAGAVDGHWGDHPAYAAVFVPLWIWFALALAWGAFHIYVRVRRHSPHRVWPWSLLFVYFWAWASLLALAIGSVVYVDHGGYTLLQCVAYGVTGLLILLLTFSILYFTAAPVARPVDTAAAFVVVGEEEEEE